jgi:sugar transferase (PEP-CTERM system associated)
MIKRINKWWVRLQRARELDGCSLQMMGNSVAAGLPSELTPCLNNKAEYPEDTSSAIRQYPERRRIILGYTKYRCLLVLGDMLLITLANYGAAWIRFKYPINIFAVYTTAFIVTLLLYILALYIFDLYNMSRPFRSLQTIFRGLCAIFLGGVASIFLFYLVPYNGYGRGVMAIQMVLAWFLLNGWRWAYSILYQSTISKIPVLIVGAGFTGHSVYQLLNSHFSPYEIKGFLDDDPAKQEISMSPGVLGSCDQLVKIARQIGTTIAIMAIPRNRSEKLIRSILNARFEGVDIREAPEIFEELTGRLPVKHIADNWLLFADGFSLLHREYVRKFKRLMDLTLSSLVLVLTGPLIAFAALAIRLDSPGPVFYGQERVGRRRQTFTIYKFRSMRDDAEVEGPKWALENDYRVTRVGKWLRLTHIDELPQLLNILKGDMSFVGPRPERPEFVSMLEEEIPYYSVRHCIEPGLTGWAQINYQYGASIEDALHKLEFDLYYLKNMSILLDLKIILKTMGVVILRDGAR